jgi:hypothetical protein
MKICAFGETAMEKLKTPMAVELNFYTLTHAEQNKVGHTNT